MMLIVQIWASTGLDGKNGKIKGMGHLPNECLQNAKLNIWDIYQTNVYKLQNSRYGTFTKTNVYGR